MIKLAEPTFDPAEIEDVAQVLRSGHLVQGERVAAFEARVAERVGVPFAVACSSGTSALHLAIMALDPGPQDEIIVPAYTFPATANMVEMTGAKVVLVEIDPATFNIDPEGVERALSPRTRAILPVHLFGLSAEMARLEQISARSGAPLIEDAACALGSTFPGEGGAPVAAGSRGLMSCWSFHPRKIITTGEGGMVTTADPGLATTLRELRNHGATPQAGRMSFRRFGPNYRMTEMQGALGVGQMARLQGFIDARRALAAAYDVLLAGASGVTTPVVPPGYGHIYQAYVLMLEPGLDRDDLIARLRARGVESTVGTYALHLQPFYAQRYGLRPEDFPHATRAWHQTLALPLHPKMSLGDVERAAEALRQELAR